MTWMFGNLSLLVESLGRRERSDESDELLVAESI